MKNKHGKYLTIIILAFLSILFVNVKPSISLKGSSIEYIRYGEKYKEKGYTATYGIKDITKYVKTKNNIDNTKIGTYYVKYYIDAKKMKTEIKRNVKVIDDVKPKIKLKGNSHACPNKKYKEEGYVASDEYDGDLTEKVKIKVSDKKIIYTVEDKSGNKVEKIRKLITKDIEKPNIILKSNNEIYLNINNEFQDPGYEVSDNCDDNIKVEIEGNVDINKVGDYELKYKAKDSSGNEEVVIRKVHVRNEIKQGQGKVIYLTFDDGPSATITPQLLNILKEENVKVTFFVINHDDSLNYLIKREHDEGHTVALHSYTHNYSYIYSSAENYFNDLNSISAKVKSITGIDSKIIRFPGGSSNTVSRNYSQGIMTYLISEVQKRGYIYFDWNISCGDAGGANTSDQVYANVVNNLNYSSNVVLLHDFESNYKTLNAIRSIIRYGKEHGYTFASINMSTPTSHHGVNN